ncbi:speriolin [Camelus ferus]|nr:speriolin [Camelus ferus]
MSLLTNYEGLRHQIERLVRENEELKKLVRLIRENHELKSAIKTQAGGLSVSGFSSGLGELAAGPSPHQGVFLHPSPAAANEPVLEEVGIVTLAPLADMLNSPQPSSAAGPIVNPLPGPLHTLLPAPGPISQSSPLTSLLTGPLSSHPASPMAVSPVGTLASSLGLPSTGPLTPSSHLASSLGLPSTGPLMAPMTGSVGVSLSSPLLTSTAAPLGVSQNLLANPMSNLVLSEPPRVRLAEPLRGCPSGPHPSAGRGPAATCKVPVSTEHPQPTQEPDPLSMTFVGAPIQTSTPAGTTATPDPMAAFSYGTSDVGTQPVNDTRGPRVAEPARKSILELERKLAHRKSGKFPDSSRESKQLAWERLVGEIAFQLDRRILSSIFPERVRLYGFTVSNIPEKIIQASLNLSNHKLDEELCQTLTQRYVSVMNRLQSLGYNGRVHPALTEQLVNAYGILRERPELAASECGSYTVDFLQRVLVETVHPSMLTDALLLLSCLSQLAHDDGKPMFIW